MVGFAYLVGSGCGTLDYLTVRGAQILAQAEVVIYDALVDRALLQLVPAHCQTIDVGKRGGQPSLSQSEIDRILVEQCQQGHRVVRLKSGDPFIFGRTTSEIQALKAAGIGYEVVPGVSSALAAPLLESIPLTDLVLSRCFAVMSGHDPDQLDWSTLANLETLVILMGGRTLPEILQELIRHGKSTDTAIAIIQWAGHPQQQFWSGTLGSILQITAGVSLSPCVIVIGEVVRLREFLLPSQPTPESDSSIDPLHPAVIPSAMLPLTHYTVLVTRAASQSSEFSDRLSAQGASVVEMPTLEITPPSSWDALDRCLAELSQFQWLILTSANAVDYFFDRLLDLGKDSRDLAGIKIAVVGDKTAQCLTKRSLKADFIPPNFVADSLVEHFPEPVAGQHILFPRVESGGREVLVQAFTAQGATVAEVPAYQSRCPDHMDPQALAALQSGQVNVITFTSSKTVKHFHQLLTGAIGADWESVLAGICLASIGPQTSKTCRELFGRVDAEAIEYTLPGLTQAVLDWVEIQSKQ